MARPKRNAKKDSTSKVHENTAATTPLHTEDNDLLRHEGTEVEEQLADQTRNSSIENSNARKEPAEDQDSAANASSTTITPFKSTMAELRHYWDIIDINEILTNENWFKGGRKTRNGKPIKPYEPDTEQWQIDTRVAILNLSRMTERNPNRAKDFIQQYWNKREHGHFRNGVQLQIGADWEEKEPHLCEDLNLIIEILDKEQEAAGSSHNDEAAEDANRRQTRSHTSKKGEENAKATLDEEAPARTGRQGKRKVRFEQLEGEQLETEDEFIQQYADEPIVGPSGSADQDHHQIQTPRTRLIAPPLSPASQSKFYQAQKALVGAQNQRRKEEVALDAARKNRARKNLEIGAKSDDGRRVDEVELALATQQREVTLRRRSLQDLMEGMGVRAEGAAGDRMEE